MLFYIYLAASYLHFRLDARSTLEQFMIEVGDGCNGPSEGEPRRRNVGEPVVSLTMDCPSRGVT